MVNTAQQIGKQKENAAIHFQSHPSNKSGERDGDDD
jgi:hypothetical protein